MFFARFFCFALLGLVATANVALAAKYQEIDAAGVKKLMDAGNVLVVNPLAPIEFDNEHIDGSVNIPIEMLGKKLPKDKAMPIVFYCLGEKCVYSWRAAEDAADLGYTHVYAFRGGIPAWKAAGYTTVSTAKLPEVEVKTITTEQLAQMLLKEDLVLLDINSEEDADKFWIDTPKRIYIPLNDIKERYAVLPKDRKIVIVCLKGQRGPTAVRYLVSKGYTNLAVVDGGMQKWVLEGRPVMKKK